MYENKDGDPICGKPSSDDILEGEFDGCIINNYSDAPDFYCIVDDFVGKIHQIKTIEDFLKEITVNGMRYKVTQTKNNYDIPILI